MAGGKLVEVGTHAELLAARGAYFRLVQSSTFVDDDEEGNGA
jgi:ABC-type multidrug transport system fused ATPase/permease subunit